MAYRKCSLGLLVQADPDRATKKILAAYRKKKGNTTATAEYLGVDRRTLTRWVSTLDIGNDVLAIREQAAA